MKNILTTEFLFNISEFLIFYLFTYVVFYSSLLKITYVEKPCPLCEKKHIYKIQRAICCFSSAISCASFKLSLFKPSGISF